MNRNIVKGRKNAGGGGGEGGKGSRNYRVNRTINWKVITVKCYSKQYGIENKRVCREVAHATSRRKCADKDSRTLLMSPALN